MHAGCAASFTNQDTKRTQMMQDLQRADVSRTHGLFFFLDKSHLSGRFLSFPDKSSQFPDKSSPSGIRTALNFCWPDKSRDLSGGNSNCQVETRLAISKQVLLGELEMRIRSAFHLSSSFITHTCTTWSKHRVESVSQSARRKHQNTPKLLKDPMKVLHRTIVGIVYRSIHTSFSLARFWLGNFRLIKKSDLRNLPRRWVCYVSWYILLHFVYKYTNSSALNNILFLLILCRTYCPLPMCLVWNRAGGTFCRATPSSRQNQFRVRHKLFIYFTQHHHRHIHLLFSRPLPF